MRLESLNESMDLVRENRIFIIEGVAGSGKDTFVNILKKQLGEKGCLVYDFSEGELLFSWKHFWIKGIDILKIKYLHSLLDYCEELIKDNPKTTIIFNRFHITYPLVSKYNKEAKLLYDRLINRLQNLPVHIFIGILTKEDIEKRASHSERKDKIWGLHQQKRLKFKKVDSLLELYTKEQEEIFKMVQKQGIPYSFFGVRSQLDTKPIF